MSSGLIESRVDQAFDALARRLTARAAAIAAAHSAAHSAAGAETRALAARGDESRWRRADLLWPLFAKG